MPLDPVSTEYLAISFAVERLFPGFIDAYFGPPDLRAAADAAPMPEPDALIDRTAALAEAVATGGYPESRKAFLLAQIRAMETTCRRLAGQAIDYVEEVRACFDIEPAHTPESVFEQAITELDALLPGEGDVRERMIAWRAGYAIDTATAERLIRLIEAETRRRTAEFVTLPPHEGFEVVFVTDKPWAGYNWYLGDARSRVDVNTDLPIHAHELTALIAHEGYPGHHTEHALKEQTLFHERGYGEHCIQLINTPECVISEGIATLAERMVFPNDEGARWQAEVLYPAAGIAADPEREARISRARTALRAVGGNAALLLHAEGRAEDEVVDYLMRYGLRSQQEARQSLRFIADPLWRPYIFTYHVGRDLLGAWLDLAPAEERLPRFARLLTDQIAPSEMSAEIASAGQS